MGEEKLYPRMRGVDIFPAEVSGEKVICLRDPLKFTGSYRLHLPIHHGGRRNIIGPAGRVIDRDLYEQR